MRTSLIVVSGRACFATLSNTSSCVVLMFHLRIMLRLWVRAVHTIILRRSATSASRNPLQYSSATRCSIGERLAAYATRIT